MIRMYVKEKEAKEFFCPFAFHTPDPNMPCLGEKCMAWSYYKPHNVEDKTEGTCLLIPPMEEVWDGDVINEG